MKNKMADVRDHLVAMLEALGDPDAKPEVIERAKATSLVANTYIAAVKIEVEARSKLQDMNMPAALEGQAPLRAIEGRRA